MSKKRSRTQYWIVRGSNLWHMRQDCSVLKKHAYIEQKQPEVIGSMEIGYRGLQACAECAGGQGDDGLTNDNQGAILIKDSEKGKGEE